MPGQRTRGVLLKGVEGMPVQVPREILGCQARLGPAATLAWINLLALAQAGKPMHIDDLTEAMGLPKWEVSKAPALLADQGWINDEGLEIQLVVPELPEAAAALETPVEVEPEAFEWLVSYWSARVDAASPEEMRKLLYWMEVKGLSHEVIAVAVEEMLVSAAQPSFPLSRRHPAQLARRGHPHLQRPVGEFAPHQGAGPHCRKQRTEPGGEKMERGISR